MSLGHFLKEKSTFLLMNLIVFVIASIMLHAYHVSLPIIFLIFLAWFIPLSTSYFLDFVKKNHFFSSLQTCFSQLDRKYLLQEIIDPPEFLEGEIIYDILVQTNRAMHEEINQYQHELEDYKEFIELWVHEIKTPIAAAQLIISNRQLDRILQEEVEHIQEYVEQVLFYARSSKANKDYIIKDFPLKDAVNTVLKKHAKSFIYQKIALSIEDFDETVHTDIKWIEFILSQILTNALRYAASQSPKITIYVTPREHALVLTIEDNGIGIPSKDLPHLFDKGFTGENGRKYKNSTGMGLYLCKQLTQKLYIGLEVESTLNVGTKVHLIFPKNKMLLFE